MCGELVRMSLRDRRVLRHCPRYHGRTYRIRGQSDGDNPLDLTVEGEIYGTDDDQFADGTPLCLYQIVSRTRGRPPPYLRNTYDPVQLQRITSGRWMPKVGGIVYVFWPSTEGFPPGYYKTTVVWEGAIRVDCPDGDGDEDVGEGEDEHGARGCG